MNEPSRLQQPFPVGQSTEPVIRAWTKGRAFPLFVGAVMLLLTVGLAALIVKQGVRAGFNDYGPLMVITLAWSTLAFTVALRRKATLTASRLILRSFFGTRVISLSEITAIHKTWTSRQRSAGIIADLVSELITKTFFVRVEFHMPPNRTTATRAIGRVPDKGMTTIAEAAKRAGSPIDF